MQALYATPTLGMLVFMYLILLHYFFRGVDRPANNAKRFWEPDIFHQKVSAKRGDHILLNMH